MNFWIIKLTAWQLGTKQPLLTCSKRPLNLDPDFLLFFPSLAITDSPDHCCIKQSDTSCVFSSRIFSRKAKLDNNRLSFRIDSIFGTVTPMSDLMVVRTDCIWNRENRLYVLMDQLIVCFQGFHIISYRSLFENYKWSDQMKSICD